RVEVVRRRLAYEADPGGFAARYCADEAAIGERIAKAQAALPSVQLSDDALHKIAEVCAAFEVDGMRADIVTARAAAAHAAWVGNTGVTRSDIRAAARLAIPHRRRRNPFDAPGIDEDLLDEILGDEPPPEPPPTQPNSDGSDEANEADSDGADRADSQDADNSGSGRGENPPQGGPAAKDGQPPLDPQHGDTPSETANQDTTAAEEATAEDNPPGEAGAARPTVVAAPSDAVRTRLFSVTGAGYGEAGRRSPAGPPPGRTHCARPSGGAARAARAVAPAGRTTGARRPDGAERRGAVHLAATIRAAAPHQHHRGRTGPGLRLHPDDLRLAVREGRESNLVLLCVDASGSMAARRRMEQVKTAVLSLLLDAYQRRDKVGLITFRGHQADVVLPPTTSVD